jgi:hypothetical protein
LAVGCWLLAACSSDSTDEQRTVSTLQVVPYTAAYQNHGALSRRAISEGYSLYTPDHDFTIGLFVLPNESPSSGYTAKLIRYSNEVWHSQVTVEDGKGYTIYGFMPKTNAITPTISQSGDDVILTLGGIPAVIAEDVCFITGVKDTSGDLLQGKFNYTGQSTDNDVRLLMDHLFAAVKLNFTVDDEYSALRKIKLKGMALTTTNTSISAVITLRPNNADEDPVQSVEYTPTTTEEGTLTATFFENTAGIDIKDDAATIGGYFGYFAPGQSSALTLVCTYDVYDRFDNKIRENCTATNVLPDLSASRGQLVTLNLNVAPTYLGQLSEADLEWTVDINN